MEKKNEIEREKINKIVKKLEIDLINAKIDLLEDETIKKNLFDSTYLNIDKITDYNYSTIESRGVGKCNESKGDQSILIYLYKLIIFNF